MSEHPPAAPDVLPASPGKDGPLRAGLRCLADFGGPDGLSPAESALRDACREGVCATVGDPPDPAAFGSGWPTAEQPNNRIRAAFLRFLALGGDEDCPVHERGILLEGAWIDGDLDLYAAKVPHPIELKRCRLSKVVAQWAALRSTEFNECLIAGKIEGDGLHCEGGLFLRGGTRVEGEVRLLNARITGGLYCEGSHIENPGGWALNCMEMTVGSRLALTNFDPGWIDDQVPLGEHLMPFRAVGGIDLTDTRVGGDLNLAGAELLSPGSYALMCEGTQVAGVFGFRGVAAVEGMVNLWNMRAGALSDDMASWDKVSGRLVLDGFTYGRLADLTGRQGTAADESAPPTDAATRIAWLKMQREEDWQTGFRPQPWEQLIKVLRDMGHPTAARSVAVEKERSWGRVPRRGQVGPLGRLGRWTRARTHWLYGFVAGYGYQPERLAAVLLLLCLAFAPVYLWASRPCAANWCVGESLLVAAKPADPAAAAPPRTLDPLFYSLDVLLPIDLGYANEWKPSEDWRARLLRYLIGIETVAGYILLALLVALAGKSFIKRD